MKPYRSKVFLACKTTERDAKGAERELNRSLERLHTDHFDLYQFHAVTTMKDVDTITGTGGAAELFLKAKRDGRIRYAGFSALVQVSFRGLQIIPLTVQLAQTQVQVRHSRQSGIAVRQCELQPSLVDPLRLR